MAQSRNPNLFLKVFQDMFTGRDNKTYDLGRILWFQSIQAFVGISAYSLYKGGQFDPVLWGAGLAALMASGGAALGMKQGTEPLHPDAPATPPPTGLQGYTDALNALKTEVQAVRDAAKPVDNTNTTVVVNAPPPP